VFDSASIKMGPIWKLCQTPLWDSKRGLWHLMELQLKKRAPIWHSSVVERTDFYGNYAKHRYGTLKEDYGV